MPSNENDDRDLQESNARREFLKMAAGAAATAPAVALLLSASTTHAQSLVQYGPTDDGAADLTTTIEIRPTD